MPRMKNFAGGEPIEYRHRWQKDGRRFQRWLPGTFVAGGPRGCTVKGKDGVPLYMLRHADVRKREIVK